MFNIISVEYLLQYLKVIYYFITIVTYIIHCTRWIASRINNTKHPPRANTSSNIPITYVNDIIYYQDTPLGH